MPLLSRLSYTGLPAASASAAAATARSFEVCATLAKLVPLRPTLSVTPVGW